MKSALLVVYPAYGRTYTSVEAMVQAFKEGRDFTPAPKAGPYMSIRDMVKGDHNDPNAYDALRLFTGVILTQVRAPKFQSVILREEMQWPPKF